MDSASFSTQDFIGQNIRIECPARTVSRLNQLKWSVSFYNFVVILYFLNCNNQPTEWKSYIVV